MKLIARLVFVLSLFAIFGASAASAQYGPHHRRYHHHRPYHHRPYHRPYHRY